MDAYRIGVSIVLANGVSPVLAIIGKDLLGLHTSTSAIERNFRGWSAALISVGSIMAGGAILGAVTKLAEKAADFQDAMTKVSQLNPKVAALVNRGEIQKMSYGIGTQLGMKVEDVAKVYGGIYGVLQDPKEAEELTPIAARYARLMEMRHPGSHPEASVNTLMRAGELSGRLTDDNGKIDNDKVKGWFDLAARLEAATHGQVNPEQLLGLAQQGGGVALRGLSTEGYEHMAIMAQMMGGQRAGTALMSLRAQMGGSMLKRSAQAMQDYGVLQDGEWTSEGGHVSLTEAAQKRMTSMVSRDPMEFVNDLISKLEAKGVTNKDDQMTALQRILGRQTTQRMIADMMLARTQIQRETQGLEQGATVNEGLKGYDGNIHANMQNLESSWHNLMVAIGGPEGEHFAAILGGMARAINGVTAMVNRISPETMDLIMKTLIGVGAGLIALGVIVGGALVTTFISGAVLIGGAITAIVVAAGTLIALNWPAISRMFTGIGQGISSFIDYIAALYARIKGWLASITSPQNADGSIHTRAGIVPSHPTAFDPKTKATDSKQTSFSLNVDGHALAQSVIDHLQSNVGHSTGAPASDGVSTPFGVDHQYGN
jgi:hypothetical protein